jgi:RNA polymerase sigma-70 factor (sigma-E family)
VAVAGSDEGFREFVLSASPSLLRTGWMLTGDRALAEDLLQTALAKTWPHWSRISKDGAPSAYVRTVMVRTYASWAGRRWWGEAPTESLPQNAAEDGAYRAADERDRLARSLAALPRQQRAVVVLRYYLDLSEQQAADALGVSVGTVKTQASRALSRLRAMPADRPEKERERQ